MGVIRWIEDDHTDTMGFLGKLHICSIEDMFNEHGHKWLVFHAAFPGHLPEYQPNHRFPCEDEMVARDFADGCLREWLDEAGLVPKAEFDEARRSAAWYISTLRDVEVVSKRRYDGMRDLRAENAVLKERIGSAFGDIDDAITALKRTVDDIVYGLGIARTWSWDAPVDQWWDGGKGPKHRTEADFRNADIDRNGYVTFRDGGAA